MACHVRDSQGLFFLPGSAPVFCLFFYFSIWQVPCADIEHSELDLDTRYLDGLIGGVVGRKSRFRILARDHFFNHCPPVEGSDEEFHVTISTVVGRDGNSDFEPMAAEICYENDGYYGVWSAPSLCWSCGSAV